MILQLNEEWRVRTDRWNYILERVYVPKNTMRENVEPVWSPEGGFHPSLHNAIQKAHSLNVMVSEAEGIEEVLKVIEASKQELVAAIERYEESKKQLVV